MKRTTRKKVKQTESSIDSVFFSVFMGENVFITTSSSHSSQAQTQNGYSIETQPLCYEGVLMDIDENYLYLGNGKEISSACKTQCVIHIEVKLPVDIYTQILDSVTPHSDEEIN